MRLYAIRQKSTGFFLPQLPHRGNTNSEPIQCDGTQKKRIRFFHSERSAKMALAAWLNGVWHMQSSGPSSMWDDNEPSLVISKQEHRKSEDMEIVPYRLTELK